MKSEELIVAGDPWRVGVMFSQTGVTAAVERTALQGTVLAIEEINARGGVLDRLIEPVITDPESIPKRYRSTAERLMTSERVRLIFGCYMSSSRKVTIPAVEAFRGILFYPTLYEGFEYSPNCIYTGACPNQNSLQLARYLLQVYGKRFLMIGSNYVYPYESNRIMTDLVVQVGGKVLDEIYVPLDAGRRDFGKAIAQIEKLKPDVVFSTVVGRATAVFYEAYHDALGPTRPPIASLTTSEAEVADMRPEAAEGHITGRPSSRHWPRRPPNALSATTSKGSARTLPSRPAPRPPTSRCIWPPERCAAPAPTIPTFCCANCANRSLTRLRGGFASTPRTIIPSCGLASLGWTLRRISRSSGTRACGSNPILIAWFKAWMTGRPTRSRRPRAERLGLRP